MTSLFIYDAVSLPMSSANHETADGDEDDEKGNDVGPNMGDMRGGSDDIVLWNESLTGEGIEDRSIWLQRSITCVGNLSWHGEGIRHVEPQDVQTVGKLLVQFLSARCLIIEEDGIGI